MFYLFVIGGKMFFSLLTLVKKLSHVTIFAAVCISGAIDRVNISSDIVWKQKKIARGH